MKKILFTAYMVMAILPLVAQTPVTDTLGSGDGGYYQPHKFNYSTTLGTEFTAVSGYGSALNTCVNPDVSYNLSRRFRIGGGFSVINTSYFGARSWFSGEQGGSSSGNFTTAGFHVYGQYLASDRLTLTGSAFKIFPVTKDPLPYNPFNPISKDGAQGVNFNADYRIGKNFHIQAGFRYAKGVDPYVYDPLFSGSCVRDPFGPHTGFGAPVW